MYVRRRIRPRTQREQDVLLRGDAKSFIVGVACVLFLLAFGLSAVIYGDGQSVSNAAADARQSLIESLQATDSVGRQAAASTLVSLDQTGLTQTIDAMASDAQSRESVLAELNRTAETGNLPDLQTEHRNWDRYWHGWFLVILAIWFGLLSTAYTVYYTSLCSENIRLVDFPWRNPLTYPFLLFTFLPVGWLFYGVSLATKKFMRGRDEVIQRDNNPEDADVWLDHDYLDLIQRGVLRETGRETRNQPVKFHPAPNSARKRYADIRAGGWREQRIRRLAELRERIAILRASLRQHGEQLKEVQQTLGKATAELKQLESAEMDIEDELVPAKADLEFDRLLQLPSVTVVRVRNDDISLLVEARISYGRSVYDAGDWELRFGSGDKLYSNCLRSGLKSGWEAGRYPSYHLSDNSFCFGNTAFEINEHIRRGQFLEAVELAVTCMSSVNEADAHRLPQALRKVK